MFTFVDSDDRGLPQKRKHVQRACEKCRKRKKRCNHLNGNDSQPIDRQISIANVHTPTSAPFSDSSGSHLSPNTKDNESSTAPYRAEKDQASARSTARTTTRETDQASVRVPTVGNLEGAETDDSRFVGDLNPEAIFLAATSPETTTSGENEGVGVWLTRKGIRDLRTGLSGSSQQQPSGSALFNTDPVVSRLLLPYLQDQSMKMLPNQTDYDALEMIFWEEVQPLFPIIDTEGFKVSAEKNPSTILMKQSICLAASTNHRAKPHLTLVSGLQLSQRDFAERMSRAIRTTLDLGVVKERLILIQVFALLSLFTQLSDDKHASADLTCRAVSLVQTLGLHLRTQDTRKDHAYVTRLFCCIWTLDRLNAAFHGRPVLMHERDFGHNMSECINMQAAVFQLLLRVVEILDRVIDLYRPNSEISGRTISETFPAFEHLFEKSGAHRVKSHLIATVEILYHGVAMLSCRAPSSNVKEQGLSNKSAAHVRQGLSATSVMSIVGEEFHGQLSLLPFVPYSLSLALRVSYRELRMSKVPVFRARARKQMLEQCKLLRELGEVFWSAMLMVELAEQTIKEMDKVTFNVVENHKTQQTRASRRQPIQLRPTDHEQELNARGSSNAQGEETVVPTGPAPASGSYQTESTPNAFWELSVNDMLPLPPTYDPDNFDFSMLDGFGDFDVFQHFDPNIDLDAIDATLGDFSQPFDFMTVTGWESN